MDDSNYYQSFWEHVSELKSTLLSIAAIVFVSTVFCFFYSDKIIDYLQVSLPTSQNLLIISPLEGIIMSFKLSFYVGVVLSSPLWLFQLLKFVFPGLKSNEKKLLVLFTIVSILFAISGILFALYVSIPIANEYLISFNAHLGANMWSLENYLNYTLLLMLANAFAFELGAIGIFAVKFKLVSFEMLKSKRRHAVVFAIILGALLTPPDVLTQVMLAIPLIILYEGLILYARLTRN